MSACFFCGRPIVYDDDDFCWRDEEGEDLCPGAVYHHPAPRQEGQ